MRLVSPEGKAYPIEKDTVIIGRGVQSDIRLDDPRVSTRHAQIRLEGHVAILSDLGSTNGTLLNGEPVTGPQALKTGDVIALGDTILTFEAEAAGADATLVSPPTPFSEVTPLSAAAPPDAGGWQTPSVASGAGGFKEAPAPPPGYVPPPPAVSASTSGTAITSLIGGITGWVLVLLTLCLNLTVGLFTLGFGTMCTAPLTCLPPIAWIVAVIFGHLGLGEIRRSGRPGRGMAIAGLVMGYVGLALVVLGLIATVILVATGVSIPFLEELLRQAGMQ